MLMVFALLIVGLSLWYTSYIANKVQVEERLKVKLWSEALRKKADLVNLTNKSFEQLRVEEQRKAKLWARAAKEIQKELLDYDLPFSIITESHSIPIIVLDNEGRFNDSVNLNFDKQGVLTRLRTANPTVSDEQMEELLSIQFGKFVRRTTEEWERTYPPVEIFYAGTRSQRFYYSNSQRYYDLVGMRAQLIASFENDLVENSALVPVLFVDSTRRSVISHNLDTVKFRIHEAGGLYETIEMMAGENPPIKVSLAKGEKGYVYYFNSLILKQLRYYPYVQFGIIGLFLFICYLLFNTFRKAEQNQVWAGMAKETAHQLGTPLSSLMAWIELLRSQGIDESTIVEMNKDISRLETVADRFSKIGSHGKLEPQNLVFIVKEITAYLTRRVSKNVSIKVECSVDELNAMVNRSLIEWVIENVVKNAVDAMQGKGDIKIAITSGDGYAILDISDTGKGIPASKFKTIFQPGYTSKKRGWGLGLSLAKRIVEEYHHGRIMVKSSQLEVGTTFRIALQLG